MRKHAWLLLVLTALIFSQIDVASGAETLTLGHLNALSGGVALYGKDSKNAITMGVEEINSKGGITVAGKNYKIEVIHYDTKFKPSTALSAYRRLVDLHNVKFIHNMGTETGRAIVPHNEKDGVLFDNISSTETFCHHGNKLLLVQVVRPNGYNTPVARAAVRVGLKRMCILADDSLFGRESGGLVKKEFERLGGTVIASEFVDTTHGVDFMPVLTKLKGFKPECLYIIAMEEPGSRISKQAREAGIKARLLFAEHFKKKIIQVVGIENLEGTLFTGTPLTLISSPIENTPKRYIEYRARYLKRWPKGVLTATGAYAYTWLYYTTRAMQMANTTTDVYKVRAVASDALAQSEVLPFAGFTKWGRGYGQPIYAMGIKNGKVYIESETKYPKSLAAAGEPD